MFVCENNFFKKIKIYQGLNDFFSVIIKWKDIVVLFFSYRNNFFINISFICFSYYDIFN